jgi:hypothetical protein
MFGNQLAAEFQDLLGGCYSEKVSRWGHRQFQLQSRPDKRFLLYLTAHLTQPEAEFQKFSEFFLEASGRLYWASWYHLHDYFSDRIENWKREPQRLIVEDLLALLKQKGFCPFHGLPEVPAILPGCLPRYRWQGNQTGLPKMPAIMWGSLPRYRWLGKHTAGEP